MYAVDCRVGCPRRLRPLETLKLFQALKNGAEPRWMFGMPVSGVMIEAGFMRDNKHLESAFAVVLPQLLRLARFGGQHA